MRLAGVQASLIQQQARLFFGAHSLCGSLVRVWMMIKKAAI